MRYIKSILFYFSLGSFGLAIIHATAYYYGSFNGAKPDFLETRLLDMSIMAGLSMAGALIFIGTALYDMAFSPDGLVEYVIHRDQDDESENPVKPSA